jgi:hypothetical protein
LVSSVVLMASIHAHAQSLTAAKILSSDGPVEIQRRAEGQTSLTKIAYRVNDELFAGDVIRTLNGGRLVLGLSDGSQAIIAEKTTVEILDLTQSPRTLFNLLRGKTRIKIEKVGGRPNPYRVNTPTTVIAVRGTLFDVFVTAKETEVFVHEGEVAVSNLAAPDAMVILSPGLRTRVEQALPPEPPTRFQLDRNNDRFNPRPSDRRPNGGASEGREARDADRRRREDEERRRQPDQPPRDAGNPDQSRPGSQPGGQPGGGRTPPEQFFLDND